MAKAATKVGKTETLTIRLDPKTRFMLEYISRLNGQTITTVVERAIWEAADRRWINIDSEAEQVNWQAFWDVSDGVRYLKMAEEKLFYPTYEEDKRLSFSREHWPFFWSHETYGNPLNHYIDILWPRIDEFIQIHDDQKAKDYFAAGEAMQVALRNAKLKPPEWPQPPKKVTRSKDSKIGVHYTLDDDIPF